MTARELPMGWAQSALGDFLVPVESFDPQALYDDVTYIDISSVDSRLKMVKDPRYLRAHDLPSRARRIVKVGDVLLATVRPYRRSVAIVPELSNPVASTGFCVLRPAAGISERFLYFLVQSDQYMKGLLPLQRGVSYPAVSDSDVKGQLVAIPPTGEQERIIIKLDGLLQDLEIAISETKSALAKSVQLRALLTDQVFSTGLAEAGESSRSDIRSEEEQPQWPVVRLGDLLSSASYGTSVKTSEDADGNLVLRIPNIEQGQLNLDSLKYATQKLEIDSEDALAPGDVLVVRTNGSIQLVGRAALVGEKLPEGAYFASYLIRLRVEPNVVDPAWIELFFASSDARVAIEHGAASTSGQHNINLRVLRGLQIPIPPLQTQRKVLRKFGELIETIQNEEAAMELSIDRAESERARLIEAAVLGELVPQEPGDTPAEVLLDRARHQREAAKRAGFERARERREKMRNKPTDGDYSSLLDFILRSAEWREGQTIYDDWRAERPHTISLLETFYAELALLIRSGSVEARAARDADGRKIGDQLRPNSGRGGEQ